jgi:hypothetical protein
VRGCLFTLLLAAVVLALVVFLGLPALAAGLVTAGLTAAGLQADDTTVVVKADPPTELLSGHADRVLVHATDATFRGLTIGTLDLTLGEVDVLGRSAGTVDGTLGGVTVPTPAGTARLRSVTIGGGGERLTASTTIARADAEALLADAVEREVGLRPTRVSLGAPDRVTIEAGATVKGRLVADAGDLLVRITDGPGAGSEVVLIRGGETLPMRISKVRVTDAGGVRIEGVLDVALLG